MKIQLIVGLFAALMASVASAGDIAGLWKHEDEAGWVEIAFVDGVGTGTVVRNDVYPEREGRELLKDLTADESEEAQWRGQVYAEAMGEYKDAEVTLDDAGMMRVKVKVGFISRTIKWVKVDALPPTQ